MNTLIDWFEIPVTDLNRARHFYQNILEIELLVETMAGAELAVFPHTKPATGGALIKGEFFTPSSSGSLIYLYAANLTETLQRVLLNGGKVVLEPETLPNNIGTIAMIIDSEGNRVGLHQPV